MLWPLPALPQPTTGPGRRYGRPTLARALGLADDSRTWLEFLTMYVPISRSWRHYRIVREGG